MPPLLESLGAFVLDHYEWRHFVIAAGMFIQWEITLVLSMYLIINGYLGWGGFVIAIIVGITAYETTLYSIGRFAKDGPIGRFIQRKIPNHKKLEHALKEHATMLLFFSKFVMYLNTAVVVLSGWTRLSLNKFIKVRLFANIFWFVVFGTITYLTMSGYMLIDQKKIFRNFEIFIILFIIFMLFGSKRIMRKILLKTTEIEEGAERIGEKVEKKLTDINL